MMGPNQIKAQSFSPAGRGAYKASEVDSFMQRVYVSYNELFSENAELKKKFTSLRDIIEEYNAGKNAIATAFVKAQAVADETVKNAKTEAEATLAEAKAESAKLVSDGKAEADSYAAEMKKAADDDYEKANAHIKQMMAQLEKDSEEYIAKINGKAKAIIDDANAKAAKLVADAYSDAKRAQDKKAEIVAAAQKEIASAKAELEAFKSITLQSLHDVLPRLEALEIPSFEIETDAQEAIEKPAVDFQNVDEPFNAKPVNDEPADAISAVEESVADNVIQSSDSVLSNGKDDSVKMAYIPDADEYIKQIFSDISLSDDESRKSNASSEGNRKSLGYNGNNTGFTVTDDTDIPAKQ